MGSDTCARVLARIKLRSSIAIKFHLRSNRARAYNAVI